MLLFEMTGFSSPLSKIKVQQILINEDSLETYGRKELKSLDLTLIIFVAEKLIVLRWILIGYSPQFDWTKNPIESGFDAWKTEILSKNWFKLGPAGVRATHKITCFLEIGYYPRRTTSVVHAFKLKLRQKILNLNSI